VVHVLSLLFLVSGGLWALAESALQLRQLFRRGHSTFTEWRSLAAILLAAGVAVLVARFVAPVVTVPIVPPRELALVAGLVLWCSGIALRLWSIRTLGRFFRVVVHVQEGHQVVQSGPYRLLRHPAYAGLLVTALGGCLAADNLVVLIVIFGLVSAALFYRIVVEERVLVSQLGQPYVDYAARTRRLIPGVW
jgi:protein-S-isoprenylcysteine O-methyltransferase Ste14